MRQSVLYHANCADGFGAAWAAWQKLGDDADYTLRSGTATQPPEASVRRLRLYPRFLLPAGRHRSDASLGPSSLHDYRPPQDRGGGARRDSTTPSSTTPRAAPSSRGSIFHPGPGRSRAPALRHGPRPVAATSCPRAARSRPRSTRTRSTSPTWSRLDVAQPRRRRRADPADTRNSKS